MIAKLERAPDEQRFRLSLVPWNVYVGVSDGLGERHLRVTYDRGEMEIMSLSTKHEREKSRLRRVVEIITDELEIDMENGGSVTCRKDESFALEPDECFWLQHALDVLGMEEMDFDRYPPPDLAHEIEISRSALNRMAIYAALKVPEVWRWDGHALTVHVLGNRGAYRVSKRSKAFPFLPLEELEAFLNETNVIGSQFTKAFRAWVREHREEWGR